MRKNFRVWLVVALSLILVGGIVFVVALACCGWDFARLDTAEYQTMTYQIEAVEEISICVETADVRVAASENGERKVVCYERESAQHTVETSEGKLGIEVVDNRKWYEHLFSFGRDAITVYLPEEEYSSLTIQTDTGDVEVSHKFLFGSVEISSHTGDIKCVASASGKMRLASSTGDLEIAGASMAELQISVSTGRVVVTDVQCAGSLSVGVSTGETYLANVACESFTTSGGTGDVVIKDLLASGKLFIERGTGDVTLESCDAAELYIKTGTGDVNGTLRSAKVFSVTTGTGHVSVPHGTTGGKCEIKTGTGDVRIRIVE